MRQFWLCHNFLGFPNFDAIFNLQVMMKTTDNRFSQWKRIFNAKPSLRLVNNCRNFLGIFWTVFLSWKFGNFNGQNFMNFAKILSEKRFSANFAWNSLEIAFFFTVLFLEYFLPCECTYYYNKNNCENNSDNNRKWYGKNSACTYHRVIGHS